MTPTDETPQDAERPANTDPANEAATPPVVQTAQDPAPLTPPPPPPPPTPPVVAAPREIDRALLRTYKFMLIYQFGGALLLGGGMLASLLLAYLFKGSFQPPLLLLVVLVGMLGAFFSALTRLYRIEQLADAVISPTVSQLGAFYLLVFSLIAPVVGGIAALVLYVSFAGEFLQGGLFPSIKCKGECGSFVDVIANYVPNEPKDYAKALVWGFIAGFSERLVPDTLQTFATQRGAQRPAV